MIDSPCPRRQAEVYEVLCLRCRRAVELPADAPPCCCCYCGALLVIDWRAAPPAPIHPSRAAAARSEKEEKTR